MGLIPWNHLVLLVHVYDASGQQMHLTENLKMVPVSNSYGEKKTWRWQVRLGGILHQPWGSKKVGRKRVCILVFVLIWIGYLIEHWIPVICKKWSRLQVENLMMKRLLVCVARCFSCIVLTMWPQRKWVHAGFWVLSTQARLLPIYTSRRVDTDIVSTLIEYASWSYIGI